MILLFGILGSGIVALLRYFEIISISYLWCIVPTAVSLLVIIMRHIFRSNSNSTYGGGIGDDSSLYGDLAFWSIISSFDDGGGFSGGGDWGGDGGGGDC